MPIERYRAEMADQWDGFISGQAINGNFLQSQRFLGYHPEGRFVDASLVYRDAKGNLRALIPAAEVDDHGERLFYSHPGTTYGGPIVDAKTCSARRMQALLSELEEWLRSDGYDCALLKLPPDFMWTRPEAPLMEYLFQLNGWHETCELTTYIDFSDYRENTLSNFSQGKRTNVNNCLKQGLQVEPVDIDSPEVERMYDLLCANLSRHGVRPVHTMDELRLLAGELIAGENEVLVVRDGERVVGGGWVFYFANQGMAHTQYLCADDEYSKLSPMTFLYYSVIERCREKGFRALSWGISTEEAGRVLNQGLTESKESFGSVHGVHRRFEKRFTR